MPREHHKSSYVGINKNRKALVDDIFKHGSDFEHYRESTLGELGTPHEPFVKTSAGSTKGALYSHDYAKLACNVENGTCHVNVHSGDWYTFKTDVSLLKEKLARPATRDKGSTGRTGAPGSASSKRREVNYLYTGYLAAEKSEKGMYDHPATDAAWEEMINYAVKNLNAADLEKLNKKISEHFGHERRGKASITKGFETTDTAVRDVQKMAEYEIKTRLTYEEAAAVAKEILKGAKENDDLYHVSTARLRKIVAKVKGE